MLHGGKGTRKLRDRAPIMKGDSKNELHRKGREGKDRKPQGGVFTTIASPCNKTWVAGVSMETSEAQTEDEQITTF